MKRSQKVEFDGASGARLAGRLEMPLGRPKAVALFAHCFTCGKDSRAASHISRSLREHGFAVLRFDFTGLGASDGDFASTNFSSNVEDLSSAAEYLRDSVGAPSLLVGHSLGGAAVLAAASRIPEAKAVVTIGAPSSPDHVRRLFTGAEESIAADGSAEVLLGSRTFTIQRQFLQDISEHNLGRSIRELGRALLVCHSPMDSVVGIDNAREIFQAARHPKSFLSLDDAGHLLLAAQDSQYVAGVIATWADRYVGQGSTQAIDEGAESRMVVVEEAGDGKFSEYITSGPHALMADEPKSAGGTDRGPGPYDLLLAALGACTAMTLRLYADRKKVPLDHVRVALSHHKIHAQDCADCEKREGRIDVIDREVTLIGQLDPAQRARLMEIADKCPVHRTLHSGVVVRSTAVE